MHTYRFVHVQIRRQFFQAISSAECQQKLVSALVDVAVEANDLQSASSAVSCLKQVFMLCPTVSRNYSNLIANQLSNIVSCNNVEHKHQTLISI